MRGQPSPERIVKDIEFEILLGTISRENFGEAILSTKAHQSKLRSEILETLQNSHVREAFDKVFQIQEMLTVLLQEMGAAIYAMQTSLPKIIERKELPEDFGPDEGTPSTNMDNEHLFRQSSVDSIKIAELMEPDYLRLDLEVRPTRLPVIGKLVRSIRIALHHLVLFYINRLGSRQARVNRVYGEHILELLKIVLAQQEQIDAMSALIDKLHAQIRHGEET
ncbi:MAG: hypothetical protein Q9O62_08920 [Ardenticatenia bacterium]|nr:hypothetical protein [Ardenticatenia bacterium]